MSHSNKCDREGCIRLRWDLSKPYCSSTCHFIDVNMKDARRAAIDNPDSPFASQWYAASVILADTIDEIGSLKVEHRKFVQQKASVNA